MDKLNLLIFTGIVVVMVGLAYANMNGGGVKVLGRELGSAYAGRPDVRPPFERGSYTVGYASGVIIVELDDDIAREYEGQYLSVYAYDEGGNHVVKFKRVVNGRIIIEDDEDASFIVSFNGDEVNDVIKPDVGMSFNPVLKTAMDSGRHYGLERCLLGRQGESICPVFALRLVKDDNEYGRIKPVIDRDKCIEDGLCTIVCPTRLLHMGE
jgi:NAD-dependent dihydropyrimidine dehydrogenase PreA subunit